MADEVLRSDLAEFEMVWAHLIEMRQPPLLLEAQYGESAVFREQRKAFRWQLRVCETDHDHVGHRHPHEVK